MKGPFLSQQCTLMIRTRSWKIIFSHYNTLSAAVLESVKVRAQMLTHNGIFCTALEYNNKVGLVQFVARLTATESFYQWHRTRYATYLRMQTVTTTRVRHDPHLTMDSYNSLLLTDLADWHLNECITVTVVVWF